MKTSNDQLKDCSNIRLLVIGGTSGIGLALARHHVSLGWQVSVVGHSLQKIQTLATTDPLLHCICCDITDTTALDHLLRSLSQPFHRIIYAAGWYLNERKLTLDKSSSERMLAVNLQAFCTVMAWASEHLKQSKPKSHRPEPAIICLASIAGMIDYPYTSLYAKCKRSMITIADAYRTALSPFGIQVNCIASGYVNTKTLRRLNSGDASHKPFIISEAVAVNHIMSAIEHNSALFVFPKQMKWLVQGLNLIPAPFLKAAMRFKLDRKK